MQEPGKGDMVTENAEDNVARHDWRGAAEEAVGRVRETVLEAGRGARRVKEEASEKLRDARDRVATTYGRTADRAERAFRSARTYATDNPGVAAAVTFAAGLGVGMMLVPRRESFAYRNRNRLVPAAAIALAHAVLEVFEQGR